jgi:hypothetical protein
MSKIICLAVSLALLTACATQDPRDAPWDPKPGQTLFEQIPAWDGAATRVCCGHLKECQPHQSPRC